MIVWLDCAIWLFVAKDGFSALVKLHCSFTCPRVFNDKWGVFVVTEFLVCLDCHANTLMRLFSIYVNILG